MKIVNMTKKEYKFVNTEMKVILEIPPSGQEFDIKYHNVQLGDTTLEESGEKIPIYKTTFFGNIPPVEEDTFYIVDLAMKLLYPERKDLILPIQPVQNEETGEVYYQILSI